MARHFLASRRVVSYASRDGDEDFPPPDRQSTAARTLLKYMADQRRDRRMMLLDRPPMFQKRYADVYKAMHLAGDRCDRHDPTSGRRFHLRRQPSLFGGMSMPRSGRRHTRPAAGDLGDSIHRSLSPAGRQGRQSRRQWLMTSGRQADFNPRQPLGLNE